MNYWLGLLTNQLYRPTTKSITPAFGFGFAVDGGGCALENLSTRFRSIPKKCHFGQAFAAQEGRIPDPSDTIRNCDDCQASGPESAVPDAGDAVGYSDACQAGTVIEGIGPDPSDAVTNGDACHAGAPREWHSPDAGDAITNRNALQAGAVNEGSHPNTGNAVRNRDTSQAGGVSEGVILDAGDSLTFNCSRDDQVTYWLSITASDCYRITFDLIL